jgi:hypothetical protein
MNKRLDGAEPIITANSQNRPEAFYCSACRQVFAKEKPKYCHICGNDNIMKGTAGMYYNDGYELDEKSKARKCPVCQNEETDISGDYCKICGTYIINRCSSFQEHGENADCGVSVDGNARYCAYCGKETTFLQNGLLRPWKEVMEIMELAKLLGLSFPETAEKYDADHQIKDHYTINVTEAYKKT